MGDYINLGILIVAVVAAIISYKELCSHKNKEDNKLLSQLNKRYIDNKDIQTVVRYLREIEPSDTEPDAYQIEIFLRFFEELGSYLKTNSLKAEDVNVFFGYYFNRYETEERGKILKARIKNEDTEKHLPYLAEYRKQMNINNLNKSK